MFATIGGDCNEIIVCCQLDQNIGRFGIKHRHIPFLVVSEMHPYKDLKELMADLKRVYAAVDEPSALDALEDFAGKWDKKYPKISKSWRDNWANLSTYFKFPEEVRKLIYTTNAIEGFNRQLRKVTKSKSVFPTDDSLLKMLYLAMIDITSKWTGRRQD